MRPLLSGPPQWEKIVVVECLWHRNALSVGDAVQIRDPTGQQVCSDPCGQIDHIASDCARRSVEKERRFVPAGGSHSYWVRPVTRLGGKCRRDLHSSSRHGDADHVLFDREQRMVADGAGVADVVQCHGAYTYDFRLIHRDAHCLRAKYYRQPMITVDRGRARRLPLDCPHRPWVEIPLAVLMNVHPEHVRDPVGLDAPEVRHDQYVRAYL